jgi:membrane fusion protein, heavy metal efflux system
VQIHNGKSLSGRLLAIIVLIAWTGGCSKPAPAPKDDTPAKSTAPGLVRIDAQIVRSGQVQCRIIQLSAVPELLEVTGRIGTDEKHTSRIGTIVDGRIANVLVDVGDRVTKGQLLAQILSSEVHDMRSEFAKAETELNRRKSDLEFAQNNHARAKRLYELKAGSLESMQRAEADMRGAAFAVTSAQAEVYRVEEQLHNLGLSTEGALEEYGSTKKKEGEKATDFEEAELVPITAPITGTILKRNIGPGVIVNPSVDLLVISDLNTLWVNAEVPERQLAALKIGRHVNITVQAYGDRKFDGRITYISDTLNPETRTIQVRCETGNQEGLLKPEMYATISFEVGEPRKSMLIPEGALQDVNGQASVFVGQGETEFRLRQVRVGRQLGTEIEILEGLNPGECVATAGSFILKSELMKKSMSPE